MSDYESGDLETAASSRETILAEDGEVEAQVDVKVDAPDVEAASVVCDVIATANRNIVDSVFSRDEADIREAEPDDDDDSPTNPMQYEGGE